MATPKELLARLEASRTHLIRVNMVCNEKCRFCNVTPETDPDFRDRTPDQIAQEVAAIVRASGRPARVSLSGGEPSLRPDLADVVRAIRAAGAEFVELQTNMTLLPPVRAKALVDAGVDLFFVSFHTHDAALFEDLVRLPGIFPAVVRNVKGLGELGASVTFNPVVTSRTYRLLPEYFAFVRREFPFVKSVSLSFVQPHGDARKDIGLMPDYADLNREIPDALDVAEGLGFELNNPYCGLPMCVLGWRSRKARCVEAADRAVRIRSGVAVPPDRNKTHPEICRSCSARGLCGGVWREYAQRFGASGLSPL